VSVGLKEKSRKKEKQTKEQPVHGPVFQKQAWPRPQLPRRSNFQNIPRCLEENGLYHSEESLNILMVQYDIALFVPLSFTISPSSW
jgi:hypothetical protein